ncbi:8-amino-7-oxononanoate synthase [Nonlabens dokdonensis]|jgi:8-amino-7-oxononanoate synthase|uniref:8-amino-7-oxononanoate synthase n=2 Tax=Nonlabens dokdonensis TaxID=328515 RepID=L7W862_NONDD|nr:pyridoxal phosphate-dependent aminotransferase family protein [Nonlabens dokdonensis]AGC76329.1 8-amino-7-oxononanoate synthase [Nonlabens dokdonensis DSW-6]PZX43991.1 8-amino-7-oxononanoate synthase [Nonlabens dokdonensis]
MLPDKLQALIGMRHFSGSLRKLFVNKDKVDFSSNDYLGFSKLPLSKDVDSNGATGSRLISGHSDLHDQVEAQIAQFHKVPAALLFNSGYDANIGLIPALTDRADLILFDQLVHASIRDGIQLSKAKSLKFRHNDLAHLEILLSKFSDADQREVYVITESVFSMDGDMPDLQSLVRLTKKYHNVHLILDEAHAIGVIGNNGVGLAQKLHLENDIFARVVTFGKAMGAHGAAVLGSADLKEYLINFARSFIYTTALPQHALHCISNAYHTLIQSDQAVNQLRNNIAIFNKLVLQNGLRLRFRESETAIQICTISSNGKVKKVASILQEKGYDVRAILSPTVQQGEERLRICIHSFNTEKEIELMLELLARTLKKL